MLVVEYYYRKSYTGLLKYKTSHFNKMIHLIGNISPQSDIPIYLLIQIGRTRLFIDPNIKKIGDFNGR